MSPVVTDQHGCTFAWGNHRRFSKRIIPRIKSHWAGLLRTAITQGWLLLRSNHQNWNQVVDSQKSRNSQLGKLWSSCDSFSKYSHENMHETKPCVWINPAHHFNLWRFLNERQLCFRVGQGILLYMCLFFKMSLVTKLFFTDTCTSPWRFFCTKHCFDTISVGSIACFYTAATVSRTGILLLLLRAPELHRCTTATTTLLLPLYSKWTCKWKVNKTGVCCFIHYTDIGESVSSSASKGVRVHHWGSPRRGPVPS